MNELTVQCPQCGQLAKILTRMLVGKADKTFTCVECNVNVYGAVEVDKWMKQARKEVLV